MAASRYGHASCISLLLSRGANVNDEDKVSSHIRVLSSTIIYLLLLLYIQFNNITTYYSMAKLLYQLQ